MMSVVNTKTVLRDATISRPRRFVVRSIVALCFILLVFIVACSDDPDPVQLYSFERPEKVALACFEIKEKKGKTTTKPLPLEDCRGKDEDDPQHLHALVTQTSRGEVAVVDLIEKEVIDTREDIPGITFVPVGEIPKAIVVPTQEKKCETTYVANFGSRNVMWLPTGDFRPDSKSESPSVDRISLGGRPVDMVLEPREERFLYVTVPDLSAVVRLSICNDDDDPRCDEDDYGSIIEVETLRLPEYQYDELRQIQRGISTNAFIEQDPYQYSCNYTISAPPEDAIPRDFTDLFACVQVESEDGGVSTDSNAGEEAFDASIQFDASLDPDFSIKSDSGSDTDMATAFDAAASDDDVVLDCSSLTPSPTAIAIDQIEDTRYRLLIADEALPVIHVIEIDSDDPDGFSRLVAGWADLPEPIVTGVPIRDLVVTPEVPKVIEAPEPILETESEPESDADLNGDDSLDAGAEVDMDAGVPVDASTDADVDSGEDAEIQSAPATESESETEEVSSEGEKVRYIYAIDDLDGSVLVIDAATNAVLTTHSQPLTRADRIPLNNKAASTLSIITPEYDPESDAFNRNWCKCGITDESAPAPNQLYGVYLVVATLDGMIRVVDVHDMNAVALRECRHIACIEDGKRAFVKDGEVLKLDENDEASYVLDVVDTEDDVDTGRYAADFCSTDKKNVCSIESEDDAYFEIHEQDNAECVACCIKDKNHDISKNAEFNLENIKYNKACTQCLGPNGSPIGFDQDLCQRCVNDEGDDIALAIRRHYPRLRFVGGTGAPVSNPRFVVDERRQNVNAETGMSFFGTEGHGLVGIACDSELGMAQSFPDPRDMALKVGATSSEDGEEDQGEENNNAGSAGAGGTQGEESTEEGFVHQSGNAFVCARTDPWTSNGADWLVQYEGLVLGAAGFEGKFVDQNDEQEYINYGKGYDNTIQFRSGDIDFCRGGVLGTEDIKPRYIAITSALPTVAEVEEARKEKTDQSPNGSPETNDVPPTNNGQPSGEASEAEAFVIPADDCSLLQPPTNLDSSIKILFSIEANSDGRLLKPEVEPDIRLSIEEKGLSIEELVAQCVAIPSKVYSYAVLTESLALVPGHAYAYGRFAEPDFNDPTASLEFNGEANLEMVPGDLLVIKSTPQEDETIELAHEIKRKKDDGVKGFNVDDCEKLTKPLSDGYPPRIAFQIVKAYQDHLVIDKQLIPDQRPEELPRNSRTYEFIQFCMAHMLMKFEVRVHNAYTVLNNAPSFLHNVVATDDKRCWPGSDPLRNSRAYERIEFRNRDIAFKLAAQGTRIPGFGFEIVVPNVSKVMVDIGSFGYPYPDYGNLPVTLVYDALYNRILVVDMGLRGLVPIEIDEAFPDTLATGSAVRYQ